MFGVAFKYGAGNAPLMSAADGVVWSDVVGVVPGGRYKFPLDPGVYVFAQAGTGGAHVRYVGQASNLAERISAHLGGSGGNDCLRDALRDESIVRIRAAVQRNGDVRAGLERTCYRHYYELGHKLCNAYEPKGEILEEVAMPF